MPHTSCTLLPYEYHPQPIDYNNINHAMTRLLSKLA